MQINKLILLFLFLIGSLQLMAETLDLGGKRIELVNGTITNRDAKIVFTKYRSLYKRGKYYDAKSIMDKFIRYYKGRRLPEAYFLHAKAEYMYGNIEKAYSDFLNLYDTYPDSKIVKKGLLAKTIKKAIKKMEKKFLETLKINKPQYPYLDKILKYNALHYYISGKYVNIDKLLSKPLFKKKLLFTQDNLPWATYDDFGFSYCIKMYEHRHADTGKYTMEEGFKTPYGKDKWNMIYVNLELSAIASFLEEELKYLNFNFDKRRISLSYKYYYDCYNISKYKYKYVVLDIPGNYIENITNIFHNLPKNYDGYLIFPKDTYKILQDYLNNGKIIAYNFNGLKFKIKLTKFHFKGMRTNADYQPCPPNNNHRKPGFSISADKINLVFEMVEIPTVKDIAIAKHGSLYDWVGLKRVDDAL